MNSRPILTITNIVFLVGGVFFLALAITGEATIYSVIPAVLCFISFGLGAAIELFFATPFRIATAVLVFILLLAQVIAELSSSFDTVAIASIVVNGALFLVFVGICLSTVREALKMKEEEKEKEELEQEA